MEQTAKRILILYTSIGLGHKSIAENIGFYLTQDGYEVQLHDAHKVQGGILAKWGTVLHQVLIRKVPFVWDWLHNTRWLINLTLPYRTKVAAKNSDNILAVINSFKPDAVISAHNTASAIVSSLKESGLYSGAFGIAFSDYYFHRFWVFDNCDFYLANVEYQKDKMLELGVSSEKIFVCGMTLKPKMEINAEQIKNKLNIPASNKVVLFSSGSQGIGLDESLLPRLAELKNTTTIVACGKDEEMAARLNEKFRGTNVVSFGYYAPMDELYAISDIFIAKAGGLSTAESLLWRLPIIIFYVLPGGEPFNYKYLLDRKMVMPKSNDMFKEINHELNTQEFKKSLLKNPEVDNLFEGEEMLKTAVKTALNK